SSLSARARVVMPQGSSFSHPPTAPTYTLSLHDALPIWRQLNAERRRGRIHRRLEQPARFPEGIPLLLDRARIKAFLDLHGRDRRSEEHTSELQSHLNLVCRLLLEKKKSPQQVPHAKTRH